MKSFTIVAYSNVHINNPYNKTMVYHASKIMIKLILEPMLLM
jgi:hypothetical protein